MIRPTMCSVPSSKTDFFQGIAKRLQFSLDKMLSYIIMSVRLFYIKIVLIATRLTRTEYQVTLNSILLVTSDVRHTVWDT